MLRVKKCYGDFLEKSIFGGRGSQKTNMKNPFFGGRVHEKPIYRGELPKKGGLDILQI